MGRMVFCGRLANDVKLDVNLSVVLAVLLGVSMSISTIRRQVKNVAYNFSDAQVKVREATSNDPWGPSTALMSEIADLTHNPMSFTEIMSMLWKRLNDHGKNWRHVYKSLVLLDYLIKCGSEKVAQQCRENIYSIETLKDFQHIEDNRDQGMNVREKAKQMVSLLYDEERLKNERTKFMMTRKKFMSGSGISSDGSIRHIRKTDTGPAFESELEDARPASAGEEEMQLQIALALSREENEKEEELRKKDDIGLQMALNESRREIERMNSMETVGQNTVPSSTLSQSAIDDLLSLGVGQPVEQVTPNPWGGPVADPWAPASGVASAANVGSSLYSSIQTLNNDPWTLAPPSTGLAANSVDPWATVPSSLTGQNPVSVVEENNSKQRSSTKTPESFLGENSSLVNLDNLLGTTTSNTKPERILASNPFLAGTAATVSVNPFVAQQRPSPSLNEMMNQSRMPPTGNPVQTTMQPPLVPIPASASTQPTNPFC
uniref:ENTH domain-containing protein n=1 Tax=Setaria digitata TaxID=48799 RepID=A0A915PFX6_9BILA